MGTPTDPDALVELQLSLMNSSNGSSPIECLTVVYDVTPLAVDWLSFTAQLTEDKEGLLKWTTTREVNNDYFVVERSNNGRDFIAVAEVDAKGHTNTIQHYQVIDLNIANGLNYYRIKQIDWNGAYSYSQIRQLYVEDGIFTVYPNPTTDKVNLDFGLELNESIEVKVFNAAGQLLYSNQIASISNSIELSFATMNIHTAGLYLIRAKTEKAIFNPVSIVKMD